MTKRPNIHVDPAEGLIYRPRQSIYVVVADARSTTTTKFLTMRMKPASPFPHYEWSSQRASLFTDARRAKELAAKQGTPDVENIRVAPMTFGKSLFQEDIEIMQLEQEAAEHRDKLEEIQQELDRLDIQKREKEQQ